MTFSFTTWPFLTRKGSQQILKCSTYGLIAYALNNNVVIYAEEFGHFTPLLTWAPREHNVTAMAWYDASMTLNTAVPVLVLASESGRLEVFDVRSRKPIFRFKIDKNTSPNETVFNPTVNGMEIVSPNSVKREGDYITSLVWSPFSSWCFFAGTKNGRLIRFDILLAQIVKCEIVWEICFDFEIDHICIEPQFGQICAVASNSGSIATIKRFDSNQKDKFPIASPDIIKLTKETDKIEEIQFYPTSEDFIIIISTSNSLLYSIEESCTAPLLMMPGIKRLNILHSSGNLAIVLTCDVVELWRLSGNNSVRLSEAKMGGHPKILGKDEIYAADFVYDKLMLITSGMWLTTIECKFGSKLFVTQRVKLLDIKPRSFNVSNGALIFATKDGRIMVTESPNSSLAMQMNFSGKGSKQKQKQTPRRESNESINQMPDASFEDFNHIPSESKPVQKDDLLADPLHIPQDKLANPITELNIESDTKEDSNQTANETVNEQSIETVNEQLSNEEVNEKVKDELKQNEKSETSSPNENKEKELRFLMDENENSSFSSSETDFNKSSPVLTKTPLNFFQDNSNESLSSPIKSDTAQITLTDSDLLLQPIVSGHRIRGSPNASKTFIRPNDSVGNTSIDPTKKKSRTRRSILKSCASASSLSLDLPERELPDYQEILDQSIVQESPLSPRRLNSPSDQSEGHSKRNIISTINQNLQKLQAIRRISSVTNDQLKQSSVLAQIVKEGIKNKSKESSEVTIQGASTLSDLRLIQQTPNDYPTFHAYLSLSSPFVPISSQDETIENSSSEKLGTPPSDKSPIANATAQNDSASNNFDSRSNSNINQTDINTSSITNNPSDLNANSTINQNHINTTSKTDNNQNLLSSKSIPKMSPDINFKPILIEPQQESSMPIRQTVPTKVIPKYNFGSNSTIIWNYQVTNKQIDEVKWVSMTRAIFYTLAKRIETTKDHPKSSHNHEDSSDSGFSGFTGPSFIYFINFHTHAFTRLFDKPNINITAISFSPNKAYFLVTINGFMVYLFRNKLKPQQIRTFQGMAMVFASFFNSRVFVIDQVGNLIVTTRLQKNKEESLKMAQRRVKTKKEYGTITCAEGRKNGIIIGTSTGHILSLDFPSLKITEVNQMKSSIVQFKAGPVHSILAIDHRGAMITITEENDRYQLPANISYAILTSPTQLLMRRKKYSYLEVYQTIGQFQPSYPTCAARCPLLMPSSRWMKSLLQQDPIDRDVCINYGMAYMAALIDARNSPNFKFEQLSFLRDLIKDEPKLWKVAYRYSIFLRQFDDAHDILTLSTMNQYADSTDKGRRPDKDWAMNMMKSSLFLDNGVVNDDQIPSILFAATNLIKNHYVDDGVDILLIAGLWADAARLLIEIGRIKEAAQITRVYRDENTLDAVSEIARLMPATSQMISYTFVMLSESGLTSNIVQELENMGQTFEAKILTMIE